MTARTCSAFPTTSRPSTLACPASGSRTVARIRTAVVLPAPFGPSRPSTLPASTARSMPSSAATGPKCLTSPLAPIAGSAMSGQGPRQPEQGQHAVVESGHGSDPAVSKREHQHAVGVGETDHRIAHVQAKGGLPVGPGGDEPVGPAVAEDPGPQEAAGGGPSFVGHGCQRRSDDGIVGEQGDHRINVCGLVGPGETFDDLPFGGRAGHGGGSAGEGSRRRKFARACLSALLTESSDESSIAATSLDRNPRTSRRTSTARWRGGRSCSAVTKASEIASLAWYRPSGPGAGSGSSSSNTSGYGWSQITSLDEVGSGSPGGGAAGTAGRRRAARRASRQRLVAIRNSHARTDARASKPPMPCQAARNVSCTWSSASSIEPRIR